MTNDVSFDIFYFLKDERISLSEIILGFALMKIFLVSLLETDDRNKAIRRDASLGIP